MIFDFSDAGEKSVFIELFKRAEVLYPVSEGTVKALNRDETSILNKIYHNFYDTGACKYGQKCKYVHDPKHKMLSDSIGSDNRRVNGKLRSLLKDRIKELIPKLDPYPRWPYRL